MQVEKTIAVISPLPLKTFLAVFFDSSHTYLCSWVMLFTNNKKLILHSPKVLWDSYSIIAKSYTSSPSTITSSHLVTSLPLADKGWHFPLQHGKFDKPEQHSTRHFTDFLLGYQSWSSHWPGWFMTWFRRALVSVPFWLPPHTLQPGHWWGESSRGRIGNVTLSDKMVLLPIPA